MSPRKVRRIANLVKGLYAPVAEAELSARSERAAEPLRKLLQSAIANARNRTEAPVEQMRVVSFTVNEGRAMRRFRPRSRGMAHPILRRTSHIAVVLDVPEEERRKQRRRLRESAGAAAATAQETKRVAPIGAASGGTPEGETRVERPRTPARPAEHVRARVPKLPRINRRFFQRKSV